MNARSVGLSSSEKAIITAACQRFVDEVLKPRFLPVIRPTQFNYPIDIFGKWHGSRYRFVQRYRSGQAGNQGEEFDEAFTRLDWIGPNRFDLQWHRHTGAWVLPLSRPFRPLKPMSFCIPHSASWWPRRPRT